MIPPWKKEKIFNIPNLLSSYRLLIFPVILWLAATRNEKPFVILICISLITDALDGFIARKFNLVTKFGAQIDNMADFVTFFLAIYGLFVFRWEFVRPHVWILFIFMGVLLFSYVLGLLKFRKMPGLHIYSCVATGYIQGLFFFVLFADRFYLWLYYFAIGFGTLAYLEKNVILMIIDEITPGKKGLYWILSEKRHNINSGHGK